MSAIVNVFLTVFHFLIERTNALIVRRGVSRQRHDLCVCRLRVKRYQKKNSVKQSHTVVGCLKSAVRRTGVKSRVWTTRANKNQNVRCMNGLHWLLSLDELARTLISAANSSRSSAALLSCATGGCGGFRHATHTTTPTTKHTTTRSPTIKSTNSRDSTKAHREVVTANKHASGQ